MNRQMIDEILTPYAEDSGGHWFDIDKAKVWTDYTEENSDVYGEIAGASEFNKCLYYTTKGTWIMRKYFGSKPIESRKGKFIKHYEVDINQAARFLMSLGQISEPLIGDEVARLER
jgi:hypothetical protein